MAKLLLSFAIFCTIAYLATAKSVGKEANLDVNNLISKNKNKTITINENSSASINIQEFLGLANSKIQAIKGGSAADAAGIGSGSGGAKPKPSKADIQALISSKLNKGKEAA